ncbi:TRAP transporter small permease [Microbacterium soli]|uniref:TRAP transporter small permease n=1 Tax=Microbacterium soli TaxID=446075 RepID=A0ABP7MN91_9MICO
MRFDKLLAGFDSAVRGTSVGLTALAGVATIAMMALTVIDVTMRQLVGTSLRGAIELGEVLLVFAVFAGMVTAEVMKLHIRTPLLVSRLPARLGGTLTIVGLVVALVVLGWMIYATALTGIQSALAGEYRYGLLSVPVWPAKLIIPLGLAALFLALVNDALILCRDVQLGRKPDFDDDVDAGI